MADRITLLEGINNRQRDASRQCEAERNKAQTRQERDAVCMKSYRNGEAIAYIDAGKMVEAELRRLCNRFQNGCLTIDDFGIIL